MQTVILCGGLGTRLYPITSDVPKCMVEINSLPFMDYVISGLSMQGIEDIVLCVGYKKDHVMNYFRDGAEHNINIIYSIEKKPLGTAGAIKNASKFLDEKFLLLNGDTFINYPFKELSDSFEKCNKVGIMLVYNNYCHKVALNNVLLDDTVVLSYMTYEASYLNGVDTGVGIYSKKLLDYIPEGQSSLTDVYRKLINDRQLYGLMTSKRYYDIGTPERLKIFEKAIENYKYSQY